MGWRPGSEACEGHHSQWHWSFISDTQLPLQLKRDKSVDGISGVFHPGPMDQPRKGLDVAGSEVCGAMVLFIILAGDLLDVPCERNVARLSWPSLAIYHKD